MIPATNSARISDIARFLSLLWDTGDVREVRIPKHNKYGQTASGYFDDPNKIADAVSPWDGKANIFLTLNPVNPALLGRGRNRILAKSSNTTADTDTICRRWLFIDIDPIRPSGISSTEVEQQAARSTLVELTGFLCSLGWSDPITAMSGNGFYALHPINLPSDDQSNAIVNG